MNSIFLSVYELNVQPEQWRSLCLLKEQKYDSDEAGRNKTPIFLRHFCWGLYYSVFLRPGTSHLQHQLKSQHLSADNSIWDSLPNRIPGFSFSEADCSQHWSQRYGRWPLSVCPYNKGRGWYIRMWLTSTHYSSHHLWMTKASALAHAFPCRTVSISNHQTVRSHSLTSMIVFGEKEKMQPSLCDRALLQRVSCHFTSL